MRSEVVFVPHYRLSVMAQWLYAVFGGEQGYKLSVLRDLVIYEFGSKERGACSYRSTPVAFRGFFFLHMRASLWKESDWCGLWAWSFFVSAGDLTGCSVLTFVALVYFDSGGSVALHTSFEPHRSGASCMKAGKEKWLAHKSEEKTREER